MNAAAPSPRYLRTAQAHIGAWTHYFLNADIPVMASTARELEALRAREDDVDANMITAVVQSDPLMTLKLLIRIASLRRHADNSEPESIQTTLVMMGIGPFFRHFGPQITVEEWLGDQPEALMGLNTLLRRAERAGQFALGFAVHRADTDASVIHQAAFLHDFAEMLLWLHAPELMLSIAQAQAADPALRSSSIQQAVLHAEIPDLAQALMKLWRLPELLVHLTDDRHAEHPSVRSVALAVRLARHSADGWENAALPDDVTEIAELLNANPKSTLAYLKKIDHPLIEAASLSCDAPVPLPPDPAAVHL